MSSRQFSAGLVVLGNKGRQADAGCSILTIEMRRRHESIVPQAIGLGESHVGDSAVTLRQQLTSGSFTLGDVTDAAFGLIDPSSGRS